jgi:hypothetical protein
MTALILFLKKWIFYALGFTVVLMLVFIKGCNHGKKLVKCPTITTTTVVVHDTVVHSIVDSFPYYIQGETKTIYVDVPANVDTAFILREYFATHEFNRIWQDSLVEVTLKDFISQNKPVDNVFNYKIKRPQQITYTTVDNSILFNKYLYVGGSVPINDVKMSGLGLFAAFPTFLIGGQYIPASKGFTVTGAFKLIKFK